MFAEAGVTVPSDCSSVWTPLLPPSVSWFTVALADTVTLYVPALVMNAWSAAPGVWLGLQFVAPDQLPPAVLVHTSAAPEE